MKTTCLWWREESFMYSLLKGGVEVTNIYFQRIQDSQWKSRVVKGVRMFRWVKDKMISEITILTWNPK